MVACVATLTAVASPARAFDTQPHFDMTRDALTSEGFGLPAASNAGVNNWFVDYYTNPDRNPHSGHASFLLGWTRLGLAQESWPNFYVEGARRLHFDYEQRAADMPNLSTTAGIEREWDRLQFRARRLLGIYGRSNDSLGVLSTIGSSLHAVQDFYAHSNWVEDLQPGAAGLGGPGIASLGYGSHPTFFDIPPDVRRTLLVGDRNVYTGVRGIPRGHGHWRSHDLPRFPSGRPPSEPALNKDWVGRPKYQDAYITAYFATRQWVRAMRTWLGNEPLWNRAMSMAQTSALAQDVTGAEEISQYSGHWQGGGEPCVRFINCSVRSGKAGSLSSLTIALRDFHAGPTSPGRRAFNRMIGEWALFGDIPDLADPPSSRTIQALTRFAKLEVLAYRGRSLGDPVGDAEIYANVRLRGMPSTSTIIDSADSFGFPGPYAPFTWMRSVPTPNQASTPMTSMTVRVETGDRSGAGTDDDVYLRINGRERFSLGKAAYDDFERGDADTYSVPIGAATRDGLTVGDIDRVAIEKSRDGGNGSWFLHGVTLTVNDQVVLRDRAIDRWMRGSDRTWAAPGFVRDHRTSDVMGAWLQLREDDFGANDTGDINRFDRHTSLPISYRMGTAVRERAGGGALLAGRLPMQNGDRAEATYRMSTLTVTPPPLPAPPQPTPPRPTPPPPVPGAAPDLVISSMTSNTFTVRNQGEVAAGPFRVTVVAGPTRADVEFPGLGAGAAQMGSFNVACEYLRDARADSLNQVAENNEVNNFASHTGPDFC